MSLKDLKIGDRVDRYLGDDKFFMEMEVVGINGDCLICAAVQPEDRLFYGDWTFDINTGGEIDIDLEWGPKWGKTGTYLKEKPKERYVHETDLEPNGCKWPKCQCHVPSHAFSMHNRVHYCIKLTEAIANGTLKARQRPL